MQTLTACPVCGSAQFQPYLDIDKHPGACYELCECGAAFLNPRMDDAALTEWYRSGAYRERTAQADIDNRLGEVQEQERAAYLSQWIRGDFRAHLDIGAFNGALLSEMSRTHTTIQKWGGVDPNGKFAFTDIEEAGKGWDLVTIIQTLEHVNDPRQMIGQIYDRLTPGGMCVCEVPNRRATITAFIPPQHVIAYDERSLRYLFANFSDVETVKHGQPYGSPLDLSILLFAHK